MGLGSLFRELFLPVMWQRVVVVAAAGPLVVVQWRPTLVNLIYHSCALQSSVSLSRCGRSWQHTAELSSGIFRTQYASKSDN